MWKLLSRLKSKKHQTKKDPDKKKQELYTQLTAAIDTTLNDKTRVIEADLKMRRSLSVVSLRPKTDSLLSRRESFAEKALKLTEAEIAHLTKDQKRKIRSLNTNSLKFEDLISLRSSIKALDELLHPSEETRTLENNVRKRMSLKDLRITHTMLSSSVVQKLEKNEERLNKEVQANTEETNFQRLQEEINSKKREEESKRLAEEQRQHEEAIRIRMEEIQRKYEEELRDEEERTRRLHEKLAKLKKMEKQFEQEGEYIEKIEEHRSQEEEAELTNQQQGTQRTEEELHITEIKKQQEMEHIHKEAQQKEKDQFLLQQQGNISFILSKLQHNDPDIKKLDLSGKKIGNTNCCKLMETLQHNNTLTTLILRDNDLDNSCITSICKMLHKNLTLHTLDLSNNFITNPALIVEALEHNFCICNLELGRYASEDTLDQMEEYLDRNFSARQALKAQKS